MTTKINQKTTKDINNQTVDEVSTRRLFMIIIYGAIPLLLAVFTEILGKDDATWFTRSSNPMNQIFAKNAWGWATLMFILLTIVQYKRGLFKPTSILRWFLATLYWVLLTQKVYFGSSFRDQVFLATGGECAIKGIKSLMDCKTLGTSTLKGGHLISGHCLLLIHASLFLWEEFGRLLYFPTKRTFNLSEKDSESAQQVIMKYFIYFARFILVLFLWLLMITAVYFHTLTEKFTGVFFGFLFWTITYCTIYPSLSI